MTDLNYRAFCGEMVELALHDISFHPTKEMQMCIEKYNEVASFLKARSRQKNPHLEEYKSLLQKYNITRVQVERARTSLHYKEMAYKYINDGSIEFLSFRYCIGQCGISPVFIKKMIKEIETGKSWKDIKAGRV